MTIAPKIYVASLSDYNSGVLHGCWIDANQGADSIRQEIATMLAESKSEPAEEYAIHDYEGFGPIKLSENEAIETVAELAELIDKHGEIFAHVFDHADKDIERAKELFKDGYHGAFDSLEAYAENFIDDTGGLEKMPENLRCYFDYAKFARDLEIGGDVFTIELDGKAHIFDGNL